MALTPERAARLRQLTELEVELASTRFTERLARNGVSAVVDGKGRLIELHIDDAALHECPPGPDRAGPCHGSGDRANNGQRRGSGAAGGVAGRTDRPRRLRWGCVVKANDQLYAYVREIEANLHDKRTAITQAAQARLTVPIDGEVGTVTVTGAGALVSVDLSTNAPWMVGAGKLALAITKAIQEAEHQAAASRARAAAGHESTL